MMQPEVQYVALTLRDGSLAISQVFTKGRGIGGAFMFNDLKGIAHPWPLADEEADEFRSQFHSDDAAVAHAFASLHEVREATDAVIEDFIAKTGLPVKSWRRIAAADIPEDRAFRGAWKDAGDTLTVDMDAAREIHRDTLRATRAPILAALDVEYMRASEQGDEALKAAIIAKKQELRDVTKDPAIKKAMTPEALISVLPECLK